MSRKRNPLEIYKLLPKTNCGQCFIPSCMAFAAAIIQGGKTAADCPHLPAATIAELEGKVERGTNMEADLEAALLALQEKIRGVDLLAAAARTGGKMAGERLAINCLGKDFLVDGAGTLASECHVNPWVQLPLLSYIIDSQGVALHGEWLSLAELEGGQQWSGYFAHRCEAALRQLIDAHSEIIFEILDLFGAKTFSGITSADRSLLIHPLPKVPFLINYWRPEEDLESKLNILFDRSAGRNSTPQSISLLTRGLVEMFRQLIVRHSRDGKLF